jgi:glycosyltransferase involved in cell wall biosynthesis
MKILYLLTQDLESPTGAGRFFPLARELVLLGHQVNIAALHGNYKGLENTHFTRDGVGIHYLAQMHVKKAGNRKMYFNPGRLILISAYATWALTRAALRIPADIVHIAKPHPMNSIAGLAAKYIRKRYFVLDCSDYEAGTNRFSSAWQRWIITFFENNMPGHADFLTTHATFLRDRLLSLGVPSEKIAYLPNGVDYERFSILDEAELSSLRSTFGLQNKRVVAFIGTLTAHAHSVDLLMKAFRHVLQEIPEAVLLIVGGGEKYVQLQEFAQALGISAATIFCGRVPASHVNCYYRLADVSVDPVYDTEVARSRFPIKLFESWVTGIPFVTADVGDRRSLLEKPHAGLLAKPGDAVSLSNMIIRVLKNPALAEELRRNGYERARSFDWKILAKEMEKVYLKLLS